ncbi:beta-galactosidase [Kutzneria buriramensis]|uniref:Beta-galactosidase n=1 Tax=Kutzneria buriramensis TaxID=1045776 RepID=A0A3E0GZ71_9PSEU|nr:beta-galactosidase [Kutzneria buriramensis]REH32608.1 beta-galactosidase [Kutzneria buriramensis]
MQMPRRRFLAVSGLAPLAATMPARTGRRFAFAPSGGFLLDGKPFQIRSGEMHPARIPVEYWRHRIALAKAMGLNTISIYVMWNYVEPRPGEFDFRTERRDVEAFIRLCQAEDMWVLLRPGPYVCGEWDLGGIPSYLLATKDIRLRADADARYMAAVRRYVGELAPRIRPLMIGNGGPVLMVQIENEYGSYGSDPAYLDALRRLWLAQGVDGPFYTEDGLGQLEHNHSNVAGGAIALSGGDASSIAAARKAFPTVPAMAGEVYPGWLTHWGDTNLAAPTDISGDLKAFMAKSLSFNLYMVHGGTSFGFHAGANANDLSGTYQPDITSYDYAAPITEQGVATPQYHTYRSLIGSYLPALPAIPDPKPTIAPAPVTPTVYASIWDNLPVAVESADPQPFEMLGQSYGFALYRKEIAGTGALDIRWVHDYATVFVDGRYQGGFSRTLIPDAESRRLNVTNDNAPLALGPSDGDTTLDILVEGMGRTNYGQAIVDRKGILESVALAGKRLTGWQIFPLPLDDVAGLKPVVGDAARPGLFFRAALHLDTTGDTYLDMSGWTKGVVWVNGKNLGRYWEIGPQHRLFCPAPWLRPGHNEILVFDLHQTTPKPISFARTLS